MRNKSDDYRRHAAECLALSKVATDPTAKAQLMVMARSWYALANQAHRNSKLDLVYETPTPRPEPEQRLFNNSSRSQPDKKRAARR
jgi:hypothetical protein